MNTITQKQFLSVHFVTIFKKLSYHQRLHYMRWAYVYVIFFFFFCRTVSPYRLMWCALDFLISSLADAAIYSFSIRLRNTLFSPSSHEQTIWTHSKDVIAFFFSRKKDEKKRTRKAAAIQNASINVQVYGCVAPSLWIWSIFFFLLTRKKRNSFHNGGLTGFGITN